MGLLGDSWSDPQTLATLNLAAGLLGTGSLGEGMSRGLAGYTGSLNNATEQQLKQMQLASAAMQLRMNQGWLNTVQNGNFGGQSGGQPGQPTLSAVPMGGLGSGTAGIMPTSPNAPVLPATAPPGGLSGGGASSGGPNMNPAGLDPFLTQQMAYLDRNAYFQAQAAAMAPTDLGKMAIAAGQKPGSPQYQATMASGVNKGTYIAPTPGRPGGILAYSDGHKEQMPSSIQGSQAFQNPDGTWTYHTSPGAMAGISAQEDAKGITLPLQYNGSTYQLSPSEMVAYNTTGAVPPRYASAIPAGGSGNALPPQVSAPPPMQLKNSDGVPLTPELQALLSKDMVANRITNPYVNFYGAQPGANQAYGLAPTAGGAAPGNQSASNPSGAPMVPGQSLGPLALKQGESKIAVDQLKQTGNIQIMQDQGGKLLSQAQADAASSGQTQEYLQEMQHLIQNNAKFGPLQADIAKWKAMVPFIDWSGAQTNQDVMRKLASNLAGARGTRSDADLANWQKAYPNGDITNDAIGAVIPMINRSIGMLNARSKVITNASNNGLENVPGVANQFNQIATPALISDGQQLATASAQGPKAIQSFISTYKAEHPLDWMTRLPKIQKLDGMGAF